MKQISIGRLLHILSFAQLLVHRIYQSPLLWGFLTNEHISHTCCKFLPLLIQHAPESVFPIGFMLMVPFFCVTNDLVRLICFNGEQRIHRLIQGKNQYC
jgi:hypothetical protein